MYLETAFLRRERLKEVIGWGTKATGQTKGSLSDCAERRCPGNITRTPIYNPRRALTRNHLVGTLGLEFQFQSLWEKPILCVLFWL